MSKGFSENQIKNMLTAEDFEYQKVYLPYGLSTPGEDRTSTLDIIMPPTLNGKSLLDIGCANGFFCFEAERRGAQKVVGVELKEKRFLHANLLKKALKSNVEFRQVDVLSGEIETQFDYTFFLNVIHHLKEPATALRILSRLTINTLVIEFPTFSDPKFRSLYKISFPSIYNRLPLIGVSSLKASKIDQTFVFSTGAIRQMLTDHESEFEDIRFVKSPMGTGRFLAICKKPA